MADDFGDARMEELKLLAEIDRRGSVSLQPDKGPTWDMVFFLVHESFATSFDLPWTAPAATPSTFPGRSSLEAHIHTCWVKSVSDVLEARIGVPLKLTHKGRVRLSELKQALTTGRIREQYGILWDGRHLDTDLQIAILGASESSPLSVGFLDMNGLKQINDNPSFGYDAGSMAIRVYFEKVSTALADKGQAYRFAGDEVIAVLPCQNFEEATGTLRNVCRLVMGEELCFEGKNLPCLSLSVGVVVSTDSRAKPAELKQQASKAMQRAKERTKEAASRSSAIAGIEGEISIIQFDNDGT
jgi:diguanylate cyclase (GGDEF)-like protein